MEMYVQFKMKEAIEMHFKNVLIEVFCWNLRDSFHFPFSTKS